MSMAIPLPIGSTRLWPFSLYAAVLAGAGLPIYIFAPKFFADSYGASLGALGLILFGLRLLDLVQDPALGWISERLGAARGVWMALGAALMAAAMLGLFAVAPPISPALWFAVTLALLFSAFSFLSINFYAVGVRFADQLPDGHVQLAGWRESGALLGVCIAAVVPTVLEGAVTAPYAVFAIGFTIATVLAATAMAGNWQGNATVTAPTTPISTIVRDPLARRLLILALVNATPLAVSSTLFLFFVESRLGAPGMEGPLLVLFFLSAALSAPLWSRLARRYGTKPVLLSAMVLAVASFAVALTLGAGDVALFALVCLASGATIGADLTLLPALFAARMSRIAPQASQGFGLWAFVSKFSLAFAAVILLALLDRVGFVSGGENTDAALTLLTLLYALVPCLLKLVAIALLWFTQLDEN